MKIVIDICKEDFDDWCMQARMVEDLGSMQGRIRKAIAHGTPLPKGHGRLIDADAFERRLMFVADDIGDVIRALRNYKTIIEADEVEL